jgi:hypothetical protein
MTFPVPDLDPKVRGTDPRIRIRTKINVYETLVTRHLIVRCGEDGGDGVLADGSDGQVLLLLLLLLLFLPAATQLINYCRARPDHLETHCCTFP